MTSAIKNAKFLVLCSLQGKPSEMEAALFNDLMAAMQIYRALKDHAWKAVYEKRKDPNAWHLVEEERKGGDK